MCPPISEVGDDVARIPGPPAAYLMGMVRQAARVPARSRFPALRVEPLDGFAQGNSKPITGEESTCSRRFTLDDLTADPLQYRGSSNWELCSMTPVANRVGAHLLVLSAATEP